ncbi:GAF and ANTAR domain-containing protein [Kineococcus gypseus]|uniref:GAF and ANTAR domain-containing protein n=1 Tax=Kineococcus gypseus TaxID=1637102 RepID=UPI003D7D4F7A
MTSVSGATVPQEPVVALAAVTRRLHVAVGAATRTAEVADAVVAAVLEAVPGLLGASVTVRRGRRATTAAGSGELPRRADEVQYAAGEGPCLQAIATGAPVHLEDVVTERRWPAVTPRFAALGVGSVLSSPLVPADDLEWSAGLNVYAPDPEGLDPQRRARTEVVAAVAAGAASAFAHRQRALNLEEAVATNREIGAAVGVLMALRKITKEQAVAELRRVSQHANRKLRDVAAEVLETGQLAEPAPGRAGQR